MTNYLGIADYLLVAEVVLDVPAEVLVDVCDLALVDSALSAAAATFGGTDLYPSMAAKAAAMTYRLCNNHPLLDGNKRVAYECLREFVSRNSLPWADVVSHQASRNDLKPASCLAIASRTLSKSRVDRASRSSRTTVTTSPGSSAFIRAASWGRSVLAPDSLS